MHDVGASDLFNFKLKSPAQVEKLWKSKKDRPSLDHMIEKVSSGTTLVPETDRRPPALNDAKEEFERLE